jgi:hypothetical protein
MSVKNLTLFSVLLLLAACGRKVETHAYVEVNQLPPQKQPPMQMPPVVGGALPPGMRAKPLTVEPVPENLPPDHPTLAGGMPSVAGGGMQGREGEVPPPPSATDITWRVPEGWESMPGSGMRLATFRPAGAPENTAATLIALGPQDVESNVIRWRGQVGLPSEHKHDHVQLQGELSYELVNLVVESSAANLPTSILGAIYTLENRTLFLKLMGDTQTLIDNKGAFLQLAQSIGLKGDTP